jgi:fibrillarin-like pre-rRNA processing protein
MDQLFPNIFRDGRRLFVPSPLQGDKSFTENIRKQDGQEFREWDPTRSKAAAAIVKGIKNFPVKPGCKILYLGASFGATPSFFSDIIGPEGVIYAVEISDRCVRDLNMVAQKRPNIVPILANAKTPQEYSWAEQVDVVYEDVASNDQLEILLRNCDSFLKPGGFAMIAIKARSIDVTREPKEIYAEELAKVSGKLKILEKVELDPMEKDHMFIVMEKPRNCRETNI